MRLFNVTFDVRDAAAQAAFWSAVVERPVDGGAVEHIRWFTFRDPEDNEFCVGSHE